MSTTANQLVRSRGFAQRGTTWLVVDGCRWYWPRPSPIGFGTGHNFAEDRCETPVKRGVLWSPSTLQWEVAPIMCRAVWSLNHDLFIQGRYSLNSFDPPWAFEMADAAPLDIKTHKDWVLTSLGEFCANKLIVVSPTNIGGFPDWMTKVGIHELPLFRLLSCGNSPRNPTQRGNPFPNWRIHSVIGLGAAVSPARGN